MRKFSAVADAIQSILDENKNGVDYAVMPYRPNTVSAEYINQFEGIVWVVSSEGKESEEEASNSSSYWHVGLVKIPICVSVRSKASADLILKPGATKQDVANALAGIRDTADEAKEKVTRIKDHVISSILSARFNDLNLPMGTFRSVSLKKWELYEPMVEGSFSIHGGCIEYEVVTCEDRDGINPTPCAGYYDETENTENVNFEITNIAGITVEAPTEVRVELSDNHTDYVEIANAETLSEIVIDYQLVLPIIDKRQIGMLSFFTEGNAVALEHEYSFYLTEVAGISFYALVLNDKITLKIVTDHVGEDPVFKYKKRVSFLR